MIMRAAVVQGFFETSSRPGAAQVDGAMLRPTGPGAAISDAVRRPFERFFRADFSAVRVHVGPQPGRIGAAAFTMGDHLFFAPGRFAPESAAGRRLLAHELAHVVQQREGRARNPFGSGVAILRDRALEDEADRMAARIASADFRGAEGPAARPRPPVGRPYRPAIQRMEEFPFASLSIADRFLDIPVVSRPDNLDGPVVRLWSPEPTIRLPAPTPVPPVDPFGSGSTGPIRIFDINRNRPAPPGPPPIRRDEPRDFMDRLSPDLALTLIDTMRRQEEQARRVRYNKVHGDFVEAKYQMLNICGVDHCTHQLDRLVECLDMIDGGRDPGALLDDVALWLVRVPPEAQKLKDLAFYIFEIEDCVRSFEIDIGENEKLYNRKKIAQQFEVLKPNALRLVSRCQKALQAVRIYDVRKGHKIDSCLGELKSCCSLSKAFFNESISPLGELLEDALDRSKVVRTPSLTLSPTEQRIATDCLNALAGCSETMLSQLRKLKSSGDFEMIEELRALVVFVSAHRDQNPLRFKGVDLNPHALKGGMSGNVSFDFPFLNKTRLNMTNRGVWRVIFKGTKVVGIYDDHGGDVVRWKGEGVTSTRRP